MSEKKSEKEIEQAYPRIQFRCHPDMRKRLKEASKDLGLSVSELIKRCVRASLDEVLKESAIERRVNSSKYEVTTNQANPPQTGPKEQTPMKIHESLAKSLSKKQ